MKTNICWIVIMISNSWNWNYFCDAADWYSIFIYYIIRRQKKKIWFQKYISIMMSYKSEFKIILMISTLDGISLYDIACTSNIKSLKPHLQRKYSNKSKKNVIIFLLIQFHCICNHLSGILFALNICWYIYMQKANQKAYRPISLAEVSQI